MTLVEVVMMVRQSLRALCAQRGFILPTVLVLLAVGALMLIPLMQFGWATLRANEVTEWKTDELYDADSGVEEAIRWLQYDGQLGAGWTEVATGHWQRTSLQDALNGDDVAVDIEDEGNDVYKIVSVATGDETTTTVTAYVELKFADFSMLLEHAITSLNDVSLKSGNIVNGDIRMTNTDDLKNTGGVINGIVEDDESTGENLADWWPDADFLAEWYMDSFEPGVTVYEGNTTIDIPGGTSQANPEEIGPCICTGDFEIKGDGYVKLMGTVYVCGDFLTTATPFMEIAMNDQTVFSEQSITVGAGSDVGITGSGALVAIGDVNFQPQYTSGEGECLLIMSVNGEVVLQPGSSFYGCVVGDTSVNLQPGITLNYENPADHDVFFPIGEGNAGQQGTSVSVPSYVIG